MQNGSVVFEHCDLSIVPLLQFAFNPFNFCHCLIMSLLQHIVLIQYSTLLQYILMLSIRRLRLKCDGTRAETRFSLSAKRTSPFKSAGASIQSTTGCRGVRISGSNAGYIMFRGSVKSTGYPLHSPVSPSLPLPCVTVCQHISTGIYGCYSDRCVCSNWFRLHAEPDIQMVFIFILNVLCIV